MKEWKAAEKEAQKMTRDGAISVNMVTGEASRCPTVRRSRTILPPAIPRRLFAARRSGWMTDVSTKVKKKAPETAQVLPGGCGGQRPSILPFAVLKRGTLRAGAAKSDPQV